MKKTVKGFSFVYELYREGKLVKIFNKFKDGLDLIDIYDPSDNGKLYRVVTDRYGMRRTRVWPPGDVAV